MKRTGLLLLLVAVLSCAKSEESEPAAAADAAASTVSTPVYQVMPARMIVRNATLALVVRDAADVVRQLTAAVEGNGGFVVESKQWKERDQVLATVTLRIPTAQLHATLAAIRGLAVRVESETINAQDVTEEFTDLGAQLRNLEATEVELRELLATVRRRTGKASEILEIFNELTRVRTEIERIQGRRQYLAQTSAMSSVTVELIPDVLTVPVVEPGWQPLASVKAASRALVNTMKALATALIWIALYLVPLGLALAAFVWFLRPLVRRLRRVDVT